MSAFEKVIGYEAIKKEFLQICDMIKNKNAYNRISRFFESLKDITDVLS